MADTNGLSNEDLKRMEKYLELQQKTASSFKGYVEDVKQIKVISENIEYIEARKAKILQTINDLTKQAKKSSKAEKKALYDKIAQERVSLKIAIEKIDAAKTELGYLEESVKQTKSLVLTKESLKKQLKNVGGLLFQQLGWLLEQQKAVKMTTLSMGVLGNQAGVLKANLYQASVATNRLGVDTKDLGKMQSIYSESIGRAVVFTTKSNKAMAELSAGTILGAEGAGELVANMDGFNVSAEQSRDLVADMLNNGTKMGINGSKLTKNLASNIKMANKYHFKGGVEGLARMAAISTKFKVEMKTIGSFADNLFDPEGAVEMASKLSVLGGNWSKLGDPFELMFKARNDLTGLTKDIIAATEVSGVFNKTTGELQFSGMEMHRLREAAKATNMEYDELAQMAQEVGKNNAKMGQMVTGGKLNKEEKEYLAAISNWDKDKGKFFVEVLNDEGVTDRYNFDELHKLDSAMIKNIMDQEKNLAERAEESLTFDESWKNLVNTFKSTLLPAFDGFSKSMELVLTSIAKSGVFETIAQWSITLGKTLAEWPKTVAAVLAGAFIVKEAWWLARGVFLGLGFNTTARVGGGGGAAASKATKGSGGGAAASKATKGSGGGGAVASKLGKFTKFAKVGGAAAASGGLLTAAFSGYDEYTSNEESGMSGGENAGRTAVRSGLAGGGAWGGATAGASLGLLGGPLAPVTVPLGMLIGGIAGAIGGDMLGDSAGDAIFGGGGGSQVHDDFISRPGADPISFNSADTLVGLKKDGGIGRALVENSTGKGSGSSGVSVSFGQPLRIEGSINVTSGNKSASIDLDNPFFIRELSKMIQEEISRGIGGGRTSSNPI